MNFKDFKLLDNVVKHIKTLFIYLAARKKKQRKYLILKSIFLNANGSLFNEKSTQDLFANLPSLSIKIRQNSDLNL